MNARESRMGGVGAVSLLTRVWEPAASTDTIGDVVLVHGYAEHSARYEHVAAALTAGGLRVSALDLRGHGASTGVRRGEVDSFEALVDDVCAFVDSVRSDLPLFLYGHSMGGLAVVRAAERGDSNLSGIVVASAALAPAESIPAVLVKVANVLGKLAPGLPTIALDGNAISRQQSVRDDYDADPLNYRGKLSARTGREMNLAMTAAMSEAHQITCPVLVVHGVKDSLTSVDGSEKFVAAVGSKDVTFRTWPEAFHELHNEPEADEVLEVISDWIAQHCIGSGVA